MCCVIQCRVRGACGNIKAPDSLFPRSAQGNPGQMGAPYGGPAYGGPQGGPANGAPPFGYGAPTAPMQQLQRPPAQQQMQPPMQQVRLI